MFKEFKEFAIKGNVTDMTVGIIVGGAFGKMISSFVTDIIMPPIGLLLGGVNFSSFSIILKEATESTTAITLNYGLFLNTLIDFLIVAFTIFIVIKQLNKIKKASNVNSVEPTEEVLLLRDIKNLLKKK